MHSFEHTNYFNIGGENLKAHILHNHRSIKIEG
jgi:hypothetical protein